MSATEGAVPLGVVIPTLDEEDALPHLLDDLATLPIDHRVLVVDGGSRDGTEALVRRYGHGWLRTEAGRARQMNAGARALATPWILFLHADSRLPAASATALVAWIARHPQGGAAHFRFRLDRRGPWWWLLERGQRLRERLSGLAYGDQGLLVSRDRLDAIGGIPELPLMEDVEAVRRLRASGGVERIEAPLVTSARRYREEGPFLGWLRNATLLTLHLAGVSAARLARWYRPRRAAAGSGRPVPPGSDPGGRRVLLVFAKAPVPGRVKTRLAETLGEVEATRIYRELGQRTLEAVRDPEVRVVVHFDPPEAREALERWLGPDGVEYLPQSGGDLGERLAKGFEWGFLHGDLVCAVGTDIPDLDRSYVKSAFDALAAPDGPDLVVGPALDGGYSLIAMRRAHPDLFRAVPWSTAEVLATTLDRARTEGLEVLLLPTLRDVDRAEDVPPALRRDPIRHPA